MADAKAAFHHRRRIDHLLGGAGLFAIASAASLFPIDEAQACTISNGSPPNAVTANAQILCQGTNTGQSFTGTGDNILFLQVGSGGVLGNSSVALTGAGVLILAEDADIQDTLFSVSGDYAGISLGNINAIDLSLIAGGSVGSYISLSNTDIEAASGSILLQDNTLLSMDGASSLTATSNGGIVLGGLGDNFYLFHGTLVAAADGILVADSGGSNSFSFNADTILSTLNAANLRILGGSGQDALVLNGSNALTFDTDDVEVLTVNGASGDVFALSGAHDFENVNISGGALRIDDLATLGQANADVSIDNGGELIVDLTAGVLTSDHIFSGGGALTLNTIGATITLQGANSNFSGLISMSNGALILGSADAAGSADIELNNALLQFGGAGTDLTNNVSGAGIIQYVGSNATIGYLTGQNTHAGGIQVINGGTLYVNGADNLGSGSIYFANGGMLWIDALADETIANDISGSGQLFVSAGAHTVELTAYHGYSGGTYVQNGALRVSDIAQLGTGPIVIETNAALDLNIGAAYTFDGTDVSGNGFLRKSGLGDLTLDANPLNGGLDIAAGQVFIEDFAALGAGPTQVQSGASLVLESAGAHTLTSTILGNGTFRKRGVGDLNIGLNFGIGALSIEEGRVFLNAAATTNVSVLANASLLGNGTIVGNLANEGLLAPGNSIGVMTVQGDYTHGTNAVLEIEFDNAGGIDLLDISGAANIQGGTVRFIGLGGAEGMGGVFLHADGGVTGAFTNVETIGATIPIAVVYDANDLSMAPTLLSARPSTFNAQILSAADTAFSFVDRVVANAALSEGGQIWAEAFAASSDRSADDATLGYAHDSSGVGTGANVQLNAHISVGGALALTQGELFLSENGGDGDQEGVLASLYARYQIGGWSMLGGILVGGVDQSTTRNVAFGGLSTSINAETSSSLFGAHLALRREFGAFAGWSVHGEARAGLVRQTQDAYTEDGASPLRLRVAEIDVDTISAQAGLSAQRRVMLGDRNLDLRLGLGVRRLELEGAAIPVTFATSGAELTLEGDARDSTDAYLDAGASYAISPNLVVNVGYAGQAGDTERHEARLGAALRF
ncbi:autotransporter outer membrane beta-barrel domain-containing protein [Vitreimonas flagellata]|uniref:autotransporter outer membrane beta-barrel domain-containing protein n=1 Tax=Vitreimonas flagellata TaxID=2560861 RepID=UPI001074C8D7|nr:autotransporter outer membrane beta-barrel domain-containing protein [Vitreimonas flagellata]